jgi:hypothetical protein
MDKRWPGCTSGRSRRIPGSAATPTASWIGPLPIVVMLMAAAGMVLTVRGWRAAAVTLTARLHQVMLLIGPSTFVGFCWQWNLIGWQYG